MRKDLLLVVIVSIILISCENAKDERNTSQKPTTNPSTKETTKPTTKQSDKPSNSPTPKPPITKTPNNKEPYGVILSIMPGETDRIYDYNTVVIDAQYFSKKDIKKLHDNGQKVYTYLNVGSVENFRNYYKEYENLTLSQYENWEEERWVDVSSERWQAFIVDKAKELKEKGVDGFFIDNCDVFYIYNKKEIFKGLCLILEQIKKLKGDVIINGGDTFVKEYLNRYQDLSKIMTGANQETVFSSIDFNHKTFGKASEEDHTYYENYINICAKNRIKVYLLEYTKDSTLKKEIMKYCNKKGFEYYISTSIELN